VLDTMHFRLDFVYYLRQAGYVLHSVYLCVCPQDNSKRSDHVLIKLSGKISNNTRNNRLDL